MGSWVWEGGRGSPEYSLCSLCAHGSRFQYWALFPGQPRAPFYQNLMSVQSDLQVEVITQLCCLRVPCEHPTHSGVRTTWQGLGRGRETASLQVPGFPCGAAGSSRRCPHPSSLPLPAGPANALSPRAPHPPVVPALPPPPSVSSTLLYCHFVGARCSDPQVEAETGPLLPLVAANGTPKITCLPGEIILVILPGT